MTHDELFAKIKSLQIKQMRIVYNALYAVMELHKCSNPRFDLLCDCGNPYPCATIQAIEGALE